MNKISIVIPTYNTKEEWLNESIESALKVSDDVIVVVDGGETPKLKHIPNTLLESSENKGVGAARNWGIENAKHEYIICLDSDDILEERIKDIKLDTDIIAIGHKHFEGRTDDYYPKSNLTLDDFKDYNRMCVSSPFRKSMWEKIGGFDEGLSGVEDYDLWIRMLKAGATIRSERELLLNYRIHPNGRNVEATKNYKELHKIIWSK